MRNGKWKVSEIGIRLDFPESDFKEAAIDAMTEWNKALPSYVQLAWQFHPRPISPANPRDHLSSIYFKSKVPDSRWAQTRLQFGGKGINEITNADIELNPRKPWTPGYVRIIILHELGHLLGLSHSPAGSLDMMAPKGPAFMKHLAQTDIDRVRKIYPRK